MSIIPAPTIRPEPKITHIKCCKHCPSDRPFEELDPEAQDSLKYGWEEYLRDFPCAWRPEAMCKGHAVSKYKFNKGEEK